MILETPDITGPILPVDGSLAVHLIAAHRAHIAGAIRPGQCLHVICLSDRAADYPARYNEYKGRLDHEECASGEMLWVDHGGE